VIIAGIDYSMTSQAVCFHQGNSWAFSNCEFYFRNDGKKLQSSGKFHHYNVDFYDSQEQRFRQSAEWVRSLMRSWKPDLVVIEGYAMGAKGLIFNIAENTGVLKQILWEEKIPFITPAPTSVKKFATTKGNAKKEQMEEAFIADTGCTDLRTQINQLKGMNPSSDIIDSYYMAKFGFFQEH
jgi:hypothetical protein